MAKYNLTEKADEDLSEIYRYGIRRHGLLQANQYYDALIERFEAITNAPNLYPEANDLKEGYRKSVCGMDTIYYRVLESVDIKIVRILRSQDRGSAFS